MISIGLKKNNRSYFLLIGGVTALVFLVFVFFIHHYQTQMERFDRVVIRIFPQNQKQIERLRSMRFIPEDVPVHDYIEVEGYFRDVLDLNYYGIPAAIVIKTDQNATIDSCYSDYETLTARLSLLRDQFSEWMVVDTIGYSAFYKKPIVAALVSDHPDEQEEEPSVLFMAGHHAREPAGIQVCVALIDTLLSRISSNKDKQLLENARIWVVPCVNPDGYDYVIENHLTFPWWRKNLRDNDQDGVFTPANDGVDLNRNYDFNWRFGGSDDPSLWYYRGRSAASEPEVQAIERLARRERFVAALDYHSFGEAVLFPWGREMTPPDSALLHSLAKELAKNLTRFKSGKPYRTIRLNGRSGQSANWLYATFRTSSFIVEVGPEYFPSASTLNKIVKEQVEGALYFARRILGASIAGKVVDKTTGRPLSAVVQLEQDFCPAVEPTRSDPKTGCFWRLVLPGKYSVTAVVPGYQEGTLGPLLVQQEKPTRIRFELEPMPSDTKSVKE